MEKWLEVLLEHPSGTAVIIFSVGAFIWFCIQIAFRAGKIEAGMTAIAKQLEYVVTKKDLKAELLEFKSGLFQSFVSEPVCVLKHKTEADIQSRINIPLAEHQQLKDRQEEIFGRVGRLERKVNGTIKEG